MRRIVAENPTGPLGVLCKPDDPADVARGIRAILDMGPAERTALRQRCLDAAHDRWNWEMESAHLVELYADLQRSTAGRSAAPAAAASCRDPRSFRNGPSACCPPRPNSILGRTASPVRSSRGAMT
jgi:hypothetical protein